MDWPSRRTYLECYPEDIKADDGRTSQFPVGRNRLARGRGENKGKREKKRKTKENL